MKVFIALAVLAAVTHAAPATPKDIVPEDTSAKQEELVQNHIKHIDAPPSIAEAIQACTESCPNDLKICLHQPGAECKACGDCIGKRVIDPETHELLGGGLKPGDWHQFLAMERDAEDH